MKVLYQWSIHCLSPPNLRLFTLLCDNGAGIYVNAWPAWRMLQFISRGHWSDCKVIAGGRGFLSGSRSPCWAWALKACTEGSSLLVPWKVIASTNYCQPKPSDKFKFSYHWQAVHPLWQPYTLFPKVWISALMLLWCLSILSFFIVIIFYSQP